MFGQEEKCGHGKNALVPGIVSASRAKSFKSVNLRLALCRGVKRRKEPEEALQEESFFVCNRERPGGERTGGCAFVNFFRAFFFFPVGSKNRWGMSITQAFPPPPPLLPSTCLFCESKI